MPSSRQLDRIGHSIMGGNPLGHTHGGKLHLFLIPIIFVPNLEGVKVRFAQSWICFTIIHLYLRKLVEN